MPFKVTERGKRKEHVISSNQCTCTLIVFFRLVECQYCSNVVPWKDLHGHKEQCGATTRPCEVCKKRVPLKSMKHPKPIFSIHGMSVLNLPMTGMEAHYVLCHNNNEDLEQAHIEYVPTFFVSPPTLSVSLIRPDLLTMLLFFVMKTSVSQPVQILYLLKKWYICLLKLKECG